MPCHVELEPNNYSPYPLGNISDIQDLLTYCLPLNHILQKIEMYIMINIELNVIFLHILYMMDNKIITSWNFSWLGVLLLPLDEMLV